MTLTIDIEAFSSRCSKASRMTIEQFQAFHIIQQLVSIKDLEMILITIFCMLLCSLQNYY